MTRQFSDGINDYMDQIKEVLMDRTESTRDLHEMVAKEFERSGGVRVGDIMLLCRRVGVDYPALMTEALDRLDNKAKGQTDDTTIP